MEKLTFTLKQHTPLIHFQHDQAGATLRATEVKPKLDRFITRKFSKDNIDHINWLIKDKNALNYKVKISAETVRIIEIPERFPCYFGNMGRENLDRIKFSFVDGPISITFQSYYKELLNYIKDNLCLFFATHNFGSRQSKGFGSFYPDQTEKLFIRPAFKYYFTITPDRQINDLQFQEGLFNKINIFYKSLRSGINESYINGIYLKPIIWQYFKNQGINWEKRKIKQEFAHSKLSSQISRHNGSFGKGNNPVEYNSGNYKLIKDLMGYATTEDAWNREYGFNITKHHPDIERMQSPLIFKPLFFNNKFFVNILPGKIPDDFLGETFTIENNLGRKFEITTPETFSVRELLSFIVSDDFDIRDHFVINNPRQDRTAKILEKIYDEIKLNYNE